MELWCVIYIFGILQIMHTYSNQNKLSVVEVEKECDKIVSHEENRTIPYFETFRTQMKNKLYSNQFRWNYKNTHIPVVHKEKICCLGYRENNNSMCEPICDSCENGRCISPYECSCDKGYNLEHFRILESTCVPVCTRDCLHGKCTAPETCTCDEGYSLSSDNFTCTPICSPPCEKDSHFHCVKPNECACLPGYKEDIFISFKNFAYHTNRVCKSMCSNKCINSYCDDHDTCICHEGYDLDLDNFFVCKPICKSGCDFGTCTAPNVCTCDEGYTLKSPGVCQPVCKKDCKNGACIAPDTCKCLEGYGLQENSRYDCQPICTSPCWNGKCIAPNICTCNEGYELHKPSGTMCVPKCDIPCGPLKVCKAPNKCGCQSGYVLTNKTQTKEIVSNDTSHSDSDLLCEPFCFPPCINGVCKERNICQCNEGYSIRKTRFHISTKCEPICEPACGTDEICVAPYKCLKAGDGLALNSYTYTHGPSLICKTQCGNGTCITPNLCKCFPGYHNTNGGKCEPICEMCNNGICVAPKVCKCHHGWTGVHCDQYVGCILILNDDENRPQTLKIIKEQNTTIKHILMNNPTCPECIDNLNNETLCFKTYNNNLSMKDTAQISCLMDRECSKLRSGHKNQKTIITYLGISILILGIVVTYILLRKYCNYYKIQDWLQNPDTRDIQSTSMQTLLEEN